MRVEFLIKTSPTFQTHQRTQYILIITSGSFLNIQNDV